MTATQTIDDTKIKRILMLEEGFYLDLKSSILNATVSKALFRFFDCSFRREVRRVRIGPKQLPAIKSVNR